MPVAVNQAQASSRLAAPHPEPAGSELLLFVLFMIVTIQALVLTGYSLAGFVPQLLLGVWATAKLLPINAKEHVKTRCLTNKLIDGEIVDQKASVLKGLVLRLGVFRNGFFLHCGFLFSSHWVSRRNYRCAGLYSVRSLWN